MQGAPQFYVRSCLEVRAGVRGTLTSCRGELTSSGAAADPPSPDLSGLTPVFFAIHLAGGHIGLPILVGTFLFSKTAKRHPTIVNFCVTWIFYSVIYCLL